MSWFQPCHSAEKIFLRDIFDHLIVLTSLETEWQESIFNTKLRVIVLSHPLVQVKQLQIQDKNCIIFKKRPDLLAFLGNENRLY